MIVSGTWSCFAIARQLIPAARSLAASRRGRLSADGAAPEILLALALAPFPGADLAALVSPRVLGSSGLHALLDEIALKFREAASTCSSRRLVGFRWSV